MKTLFKKIIVTVITWEARLIVQKYKPHIIAVTGSVGKTSTKDTIYTALNSFKIIRRNEKSYNSEIGIPLTILGCPNAWNNVFLWLANIIHGLRLILGTAKYPEWLVMEVGADHPGDIRKVSEWLRSDIVVMTRIGETPVHVEFYPNKADLIREKGYLPKTLTKDGTLILNADDDDIMSYRTESKHRVMSFGIERPADVTASHMTVQYDANGKPTGMNVKINYRGSSVPLNIHGVLGAQHIYPVLAAICVGLVEHIGILELTQTLETHIAPHGRMNILAGINESTLIDDTYNSSPVAAQEALKTLAGIDAHGGRKIAVLGDMMELGKYSVEEHSKIGQYAATVADVVVAVGLRAARIAESARTAGMHGRTTITVADSRAAAEVVAKMLKPHDVVLIKGSQSVRMERITAAVLAESLRASSTELLVRQDAEWLAK